jgi:hypothetical protein
VIPFEIGVMYQIPMSKLEATGNIAGKLDAPTAAMAN